MSKKPESEIWKWVPGYEWFYLVSNKGNIKIHRTNKNKALMTDHDGYLRVHLYKRGDRKVFSVHRLVAMAFLEKPPEDYTEVNHKDCNRQNNRVENLEWVTRQQNMILRYGDGTEEINVVDNESSQIVAICRSYKEAERFAHVSHATIKNIIGTNKAVKGYRFENGF
ncbi:MAG: NUMOD4 motif-containing HNH endonuclease [Bacteroidales bacterium]|jgi:hypothetical protein|nr:NUMOD4 motif-containing HNH endonuclease [Bacteroidales bacterium]